MLGWIERSDLGNYGRDFVGPVPVIVGATGSGKTGVGIEVAKAVGGEIISADSRTVYKGMDLGTAKPSLVEREGVLHFGFDLVEPGERFTVADWKQYAERKIKEIQKRDGVPIVVGGTGLYVDALVFDYRFETGLAEGDLGAGVLNGEDFEVEQENCSEGNRRGLVGAPDREEMDKRFMVFGIEWKREELKRRLRERVSKMFSQEMFDETERLARQYGWENQAMKSNIYQFVWGYMRGEYSLEKAIELASTDDWHLAKRQLTWFKRNKNIVWLPLEKIKDSVIKCIQDEQRK